jgi:hypothetical protein
MSLTTPPPDILALTWLMLSLWGLAAPSRFSIRYFPHQSHKSVKFAYSVPYLQLIRPRLFIMLIIAVTLGSIKRPLIYITKDNVFGPNQRLRLILDRVEQHAVPRWVVLVVALIERAFQIIIWVVMTVSTLDKFTWILKSAQSKRLPVACPA